MKINTVLGTIDSKDMGVTLMHEHISTIEWNFARAFPGFFDKEEAVRLFCQEMEPLKAYGLKTFVDATPITLGRDVEGAARDLHLIAAHEPVVRGGDGDVAHAQHQLSTQIQGHHLTLGHGDQLEGSALSLEGDEAYFNEFFIPGIMLVGGIQGCLELADCNIELF